MRSVNKNPKLSGFWAIIPELQPIYRLVARFIVFFSRPGNPVLGRGPKVTPEAFLTGSRGGHGKTVVQVRK